MVTKKSSRIAPNPKEKAVAPGADEWINQGGIDPEVKEPKPSNQTTPQRNTGDDQTKKYPHRISFDVDQEGYKRLKRASFDSERSMNEILREAVDEWMKARNY
jgi:hypothetical protein